MDNAQAGPPLMGACTQNRRTDLRDVIVNDQPELIGVHTRIPGDYGPAFAHEQRKTLWEREIEMPQLVGDTISGSHNGRLVQVPLDRVTRVIVLGRASAKLLWCLRRRSTFVKVPYSWHIEGILMYDL